MSEEQRSRVFEFAEFFLVCAGAVVVVGEGGCFELIDGRGESSKVFAHLGFGAEILAERAEQQQGFDGIFEAGHKTSRQHVDGIVESIEAARVFVSLLVGEQLVG